MAKTVGEPKYSIASPEFQCRRCEAAIAEGAPYFSAVQLVAAEFLRNDYCPVCWQTGARSSPVANTSEPSSDTEEPNTEEGPEFTEADNGAATERIFAHWRTRRPEASQEGPRRVRLDVELLYEFFCRLSEMAAEDKAAEEEPPGRLDAQDLAANDFDGGGEFVPASTQIDGKGREAPASEETEDTDLGRAPEESTERSSADDALIESVGTEAASDELEELAPVESDPGGLGASPRERAELRFFLSLLLVRKKVLDYRRRGEPMLLTDKRQPGTVHEVSNPGLNHEQLEALKDRIGELLQMQL